jgi:aminoglycoside phosphotransferase
MDGAPDSENSTDVYLTPQVLRWVAEVAGGPVADVDLASSGGRRGYRLDVERPDGKAALFLLFGRPTGEGSFNPVPLEAEVLRALERLGVATPHVWGVSAEHNALLVERPDGAGWFHEPADPLQRVAVARDYIRQIARWHATPAAALDLPSFPPPRRALDHQKDQLVGIRRLFETADAEAPIDEIARASLDYLERELPAYDGPAVLCQGDTGPGNFIYAGDKVLGVIDWELAHLGDPMDDIAWLSWRATQHGFPEFPERLREYEQLSGIKVVPERVYYYRVNACARLGPDFGSADMGRSALLRRRREPSGGSLAADNDRAASQMVMSMLHRRMRLQALGTALGIDLPSREPVEVAKPREHAPMYDNLLQQFQVMVPRIDDRQAVNLAKTMVREIKYLKAIDRDGALFENQELNEISGLLGRTPDGLTTGRADLAEAARARRITFEAYFHYHWNRMVRDDHLMREASGRLYERSWPPLT